MADELKNINIKIKGAEDTGPQIKIRDQNNRTYSFFKNKKDGGETVALQNYRNFKVGDEVELSFREVPYKETTIRNVASIRPATGPVEDGQQVMPNFKAGRPTPEYWERREAKRQSSILVQVAFKAALALQAAYVEAGKEEDRDKLYNDTLEFYDWLDLQIGEEQAQGGGSDSGQLASGAAASDSGEDLGF